MQVQEVLSIVIIAYAVAEAVKVTPLNNKYIPMVVSFVGAIVAVLAKATNQLFLDTNWVDSIAIGISSGLASVGLNQWKKQFSGEYETEDSEDGK